MLLDGFVLVSGRQAARLLDVVPDGLARMRENGESVSDELAILLADLRTSKARWVERLTASASGSPEVPQEPELSYCEATDEIGTTEAAKVLGITDRGVRDAIKAGRLEGRRCGHAWRVTELAVMEYAETRRNRGAQLRRARTG